jgi:hypothetical protein
MGPPPSKNQSAAGGGHALSAGLSGDGDTGTALSPGVPNDTALRFSGGGRLRCGDGEFCRERERRGVPPLGDIGEPGSERRWFKHREGELTWILRTADSDSAANESSCSCSLPAVPASASCSPHHHSVLRGSGFKLRWCVSLSVLTSRVSPPGPLSTSYGHVGCLKPGAFPPRACEPTSSSLNIIWSRGLFEARGLSTSRVSPPGPLSTSYGYVGCLKPGAFPPRV